MTGLKIPSSYKDVGKEHTIACRLNDSEYNWIKKVAYESEMTVSGIIRFLIDREIDEI